jgi:hypothetical protein
MLIAASVHPGMKLIALAALAMLTACSGSIGTHRDSHRIQKTIDGAGADDVRATVKLTAGELRISGGGSKLLEADIRTTGEADIRYDSGTHARLSVGQPELSFARGNMENEWDLRFGDGPKLDMEIHLGAGEADIDLGDVKLRNLVIHMGAGQLKLDLRGKYADDVDVEIHGGVGEADIRLPHNMQIDADVHGGLGEVETHGLEQDDDHHYVTRRGGNAPRMRLEIHGGIGSIKLNAVQQQ